MKKLLLFSLVLSIGLMSFSQNLPTVSKELLNKAVKTEFKAPVDDATNFYNPVNLTRNTYDVIPSEHQIGNTWYDLWSNTMIGNRFYVHEDGTMAGVWIMGFEASAFPDRGTGYNYYNGTEWGSWPTERIENRRCGWPSYAPWGPNGEITVSHNGVEGLEICTRPIKGEGDWTQANYLGPTGIENDPTWPRMITSGENHEIIHLFYNSYVEYMGQATALLYSRSDDGCSTWDPQDVILDGLGSDYYTEIGADDYVLAARGNTVALLVGGAWNDLFMLKSTDNGDTWEKTVIWLHPYPFFDWATTSTDTFFCVDNSANIVIDYDGMAHVVFGINRVLHYDLGTTYYLYPYVDGIGYWNETMPMFNEDEDNVDALAPPQYEYPNSEMIEDYNYIGCMQDVDGDGVITLNSDILFYRELGPSTMPSITVDENGDRFLLYASTTETYEMGDYNYKHVWARAYMNGEWGPFLDASSDIIHWFDECIYPTVASNSDDNIHYIYQTDVLPGLALDDDHSYQENIIYYASLPKGDLVSVPESNKPFTKENVSQNFPNPFKNTSVVTVKLEKATDLSLEVFNLTGQKVYEINNGKVGAGSHTLTIDASNLSSGVYFYTVFAGEDAVTKKMIVN
jgi:hypothetical protein